MQATKQFLKTWKHDILAGSFAISIVLLLLQLLSAGSAWVTAEAPPASPASLGVSPETTDAPDQLARAGETGERGAPESPRVDEEAAEQTDVSSEQADQDAGTSDESPASPEAQREPEELPQDSTPTPGSDREPADTASQQLANTATPPKPNPVEERPKRVEEMSAQDIEKAIEAYEQWVHQGDIRLILQWAMSPEQLNSITLLYVVGTASTTLAIAPNGAVFDITSRGVPAGKLIGDLPPDRSKWPSVVIDRARERLGPSYVARSANFLLTDACVLTLYRTLAHEVGRDKPGPAAEYVLRLVARDRQIQVELIRNN